MQNFGLVSIIMPNWNCGLFIADSIESVLNQTYTNWELLIQDDCSTDDSMEIAQEYAMFDERIYIEKNFMNSGAAITRNNALRRAKGRWVAFLDSDDLWDLNKLEKQLKFMFENKVFFSYHEYMEVNEHGNELGIYVSGKEHVGTFAMYACCWPGCLTVMYNAEKVGLIQICDIQKNNDFAMWLKIIHKVDCFLLKENLARYRRRKNSITPPSITSRILWHYKLFRKSEKMNPIIAFIFMCINVLGSLFKKSFYVNIKN